MKNKGYRITILLAFVWTVLLPFLWAYNLSNQFGLGASVTFLAYRPELIAVVPSAVWLAGAWQQKRWAIPGLWIGAFGVPLLKTVLGGAPTDGWMLGTPLFIALALRLRFLRRSCEPQPLETGKSA